MSTIDSDSTLAEVQAAYDDNASYAEDNDATKARAFITAARVLLRRMFSTATKGSNNLSYRVDLLREELKHAEDWLLNRDSTERLRQFGPSVTRADFRGFRY